MGFRESYSEPDLESAIDHGIDGDADKVQFVDYDESNNHIQLIESIGSGTTALTKFYKGWAVDRSDEEILKALVQINRTQSSHWAEILEGFRSSSLPPVIVVNKKLCDGCHRIILCYLFNHPVRVAKFFAPPLEY